mgnify:CR=1 FL=1
MKQTFKKFTPTPVWKFGSDVYWAWRNRGRHVLARSFSARWSASRQSLVEYHNKHQGQRCFIIGNGPSLRQTDLSKLRGEFTFGLNRVYLLFPEMGFNTTCLVSVNDLVLEQCAAEIQVLGLPRFVTWRARGWFRPDPGLTYLDTDFTGEETFAPDCLGRVFEGYTVTYVALQLAFFMGFEQVILIGVDHNFVTKGKANEAGHHNRWRRQKSGHSKDGEEHQCADRDSEAHGDFAGVRDERRVPPFLLGQILPVLEPAICGCRAALGRYAEGIQRDSASRRAATKPQAAMNTNAGLSVRPVHCQQAHTRYLASFAPWRLE